MKNIYKNTKNKLILFLKIRFIYYKFIKFKQHENNLDKFNVID